MDVIHIVYIYIFQLFINVQTYLANFAPFLCFFISALLLYRVCIKTCTQGEAMTDSIELENQSIRHSE